MICTSDQCLFGWTDCQTGDDLLLGTGGISTVTVWWNLRQKGESTISLNDLQELQKFFSYIIMTMTIAWYEMSIPHCFWIEIVGFFN